MAQPPLVWLITGCSSGFGEQFVHQALARGDKVIASGRNAATKLAKFENTDAAILDLDVSLPESEITKKVHEAIAFFGHVDILVNNAGYIQSASFEELGNDYLRRSFDVNFFGPANVARALLPHMRERKQGTIAWIGSVAGIKGDPSATGYCAAKHAIEGLVDCLAQELAMFGLKTLIFEPGYFRTSALKQGNLQHSKGFISAYEQFNQMVLQFETGVYGTEPGDPVKGVATMIEFITATGRAEGKEIPRRIPIGSDVLQVKRDRLHAELKVCDEWESVLRSTDIAAAAASK